MPLRRVTVWRLCHPTEIFHPLLHPNRRSDDEPTTSPTYPRSAATHQREAEPSSMATFKPGIAIDRSIHRRKLVDDPDATCDGAVPQSANHVGTTLSAHQSELQHGNGPLHSGICHSIDRISAQHGCGTHGICGRSRLGATWILRKNIGGWLANAATGDLLLGSNFAIDRKNHCTASSTRHSKTVCASVHGVC